MRRFYPRLRVTDSALSSSRRNASLKTLIRSHGLPLAAYYLLFNESCVLAITFLLHTDRLGVGDIVSAVDYVGLGSYFNVNEFGSRSVSLFGLTVSGKLVMNFGVATAFMSLWTPLQIPFCVATLPVIVRWLGRTKGAKVVSSTA